MARAGAISVVFGSKLRPQESFLGAHPWDE